MVRYLYLYIAIHLLPRKRRAGLPAAAAASLAGFEGHFLPTVNFARGAIPPMTSVSATLHSALESTAMQLLPSTKPHSVEGTSALPLASYSTQMQDPASSGAGAGGVRASEEEPAVLPSTFSASLSSCSPSCSSPRFAGHSPPAANFARGAMPPMTSVSTLHPASEPTAMQLPPPAKPHSVEGA